jgi:type II secretory pathway pseudopilin PulG
MRTIPKSGGFSLLEILVALSVMVVGMTSILVLFAVGVTTHKRSIDQMNAALAAEVVASDLKARYTVYRIEQWKKKEARRTKKSKKKAIPLDDRNYLKDIPDKRGEEPAVPNFPGYRYRVKFTPLDDDGNAVYARIDIIWKKGGDPVSESYPLVLFKKPF